MKTKEPQITQIHADCNNRVMEPRDAESHAVIGAAMEVHRELGAGFLEAVYHEALAREFALRSIPFKAEALLKVFYKGEALDCTYRADFLCFGDLIVEIKAVQAIGPVDSAQLINYLRAGSCSRGLLLNFCSRSLEYRRFVSGYQSA
ncbi:MAG: GxxExxY protein [Xanthomonadaceae bacterium]|nr:GxxExxY protein [Xanthomonadaceae bacterium]